MISLKSFLYITANISPRELFLYGTMLVNLKCGTFTCWTLYQFAYCHSSEQMAVLWPICLLLWFIFLWVIFTLMDHALRFRIRSTTESFRKSTISKQPGTQKVSKSGFKYESGMVKQEWFISQALFCRRKGFLLSWVMTVAECRAKYEKLGQSAVLLFRRIQKGRNFELPIGYTVPNFYSLYSVKNFWDMTPKFSGRDHISTGFTWKKFFPF